MNTQPLAQSPEDLHAPYAVRQPLGRMDAKVAPRLLELRTASGSVYVCPSRWQRLRLLWAFRHFHVLPAQVLSRGDQRLIEKLFRSAVVSPPQPAARNAVLGVVEKLPAKATESPRRQAPGKKEEQITARAALGVYGPFRQWGALAMLIAVCVVVILARVYAVSLPPRTAQMKKPPPQSGLARQTAAGILPLIAPSPAVEKPRHRVTSLAAEPLLVGRNSAPPESSPVPSITDSSSAVAAIEPAAMVTSTTEQRLFVSELPRGRFVAPTVSDPNLVGEVQLRALIDANGSVKEVNVVSGDPKLAEAGMRAVRNWHYSQYQALGRQGEGETLIRMNFFGQDAVSVTSIAR